MKKLIRKIMLSGLVTLLLTLASAGVASACTSCLYQPEVPRDE